ncbi:DUF4886 domain-containing protein [Sphingobacterium sp. lm-10]|uniref:DUF4886 domain-containing protein n=1 Tax=Sphingobacterium sp. lm-10 TaxID=2944904 RepID=UPI0020216BE2|nr:DUF4886 domain-containing protein [Sphingobacterium sp. lm-10]MCL7989176.1 DUF4886 domain-containing protein [Sphingobacterium sp. lm-10]
MMKRYTIYALVLLLSLQVGMAQVKDAVSKQALKVLAIGNSFSEDALENYLHELAATADREIIIGNLYIGGAPLDLHVRNAQEDKAAYSYRKVHLDGSKTTQENTSISTALADEDWDYVSLQQASPLSGQYNVIMESLPSLMDYVKGKVSPHTQLVYHQTWAYQADSEHEGFVNYQKSQQHMYEAIASATKKISKQKGFAFVVPCGTAIQNARSSSIGDHYTRDGYHLDLNYGRFTAACTWYEKLFKLDSRKNTYKPAGITASQADIAKAAAHAAVKNPFKITLTKK